MADLSGDPLVRFGEAVRLAKEKMDQKNIYFTNPAFDSKA